MNMEKVTVELIEKLKKLAEDEECKWLSGDSSLSLNDIYLIRESYRCIKSYKDTLDDTYRLMRTLDGVFRNGKKHTEEQEKNCSTCVYSQKVREGVFQCLGEKEIQYRKETDSCGWWKGSD